MRRWMWLGALLLLLGVGPSAQAQRRGGIFFGGVDPTQIVNVPIDTSQSAVPIASPMTRKKGFSLLDLVPRLSLPKSRPIIGRSIFPSEDQLPGLDYLKAFRYRGPQQVDD